MSGAVYKVRSQAIYAWGLGNFGESVMMLTATTLLMPIFNTGFGLSAVLVSWAISTPRLIDTFVDPYIGYLSDRTRTRWGRRKPYLLAGCIGAAVLLVGIWWASRSWGEYVQFAFLLGCSLVFWLAYSCYYIPLVALGAELTDDYHERTKVVAVRIFFNQLGTIVVGWLYWLALRPAFGGEINGIRVIAIPLAGIVLLSGLLTVRYCRERFQHTEAAKTGLWQSIRTAVKNRWFGRLIAIRLLTTLGFTLFATLNWYINTYHIAAGDKAIGTRLMGIWSSSYAIVTVVLLPFATPLSRRWGKSFGLRLGVILMLATAVVMPFLQHPSLPYLQFAGTVLMSISTTLTLLFLAAFLPDVCDLDEVETSQRREGVYGAVMVFATKIEASICTLVAGYIIQFAGFDQSMTAQPAEVIDRLRWCAYLPYILCSAIGLYLAWRFPITETIMTQVRHTLDERRQRENQPPENRSTDPTEEA